MHIKPIKLLAVLAVCLGLAGCDTTDFRDDFEDATLLPPYVAFDTGQLGGEGWAFTAAQAERGSFRNYLLPGNLTAAANLTGLRIRLPEAIEQNVTVNYQTSGTAVYGRDYRLFVRNAGGDWIETPIGENGAGSLQIVYTVENPTEAEIAPHSRDLRVAVQPGATYNTTLRIELTGATAADGSAINVGRVPDGRDRIVTLQISPTPIAASAAVTCPAEPLEVGEEGEFTAVFNATATRPLTFAWTFGDGTTANTTTATTTHTYAEAGTYEVSVVIASPINSRTVTCEVEVVEAEDDDDDDDNGGE